MNAMMRKIRRWRYAKRCAGCGRKFMWKHECKAGISGPDYTLLPEGMKVERKLKPDSCCENCTDINKEIANGQIQK